MDTAIRTLRIGTRGSALALVQARWVAARLAEHDVASELVIIRTEGDDRPVDTAWGEGAFVGRIVASLLDGSVDVAVHSAKDVPTDEDPNLAIAAYPAREDPRDALVCRVRGMTLATLPDGARVGTDSPRRTAFLHALRPDLVMHPLHGNVDTRLAKLDRGDTDALVLAVAGLTRLGRAARIDDVLPLDRVACAPGQGSLAIQVRADDAFARAAVGMLDDPATRAAVEAERALLAATGGGCRSPIGASGRVVDGRLELVAAAERDWVARADGSLAATPVAWVRGSADPAHRRYLACWLAARLVASRARPRVLVARPAEQATALLDLLDTAGLDAVHVPAIEIESRAEDWAFASLPGGARPGTLVAITSTNAVVATVAALASQGIDPGTLRWAAVGEGTLGALQDAGIVSVFVPSRANGATLGAELPLQPGERVLLPRADIADAVLPAALRARGADVHEIVAYRTREAPAASRPLLATALDDGPIDALVVTSGSVARGLAALATGATRDLVLATPVVAAGAKAARGARDAGFTTVLTAPAPAPAALAAFTARALGVAPVAQQMGAAR